MKRSPRARRSLFALVARDDRWKKIRILAISATMIAIAAECRAQLPGAAGGQPSLEQRYRSYGDSLGGSPTIEQKGDPFFEQVQVRGQGYLENDKVNQALAALQEARKSLQEAIAKKDQVIIVQQQEQLKTAISDYLKQDQAVSETHLKRLRDQWSALEASHKRRVAARQELIDLQLQAMLLAKQGLSIPTTDNPSALPPNWLTFGNPAADGMGMPGMGIAPGGIMGDGPGAGNPGGAGLLGGGEGGGDVAFYGGNGRSPLKLGAEGSAGTGGGEVINYSDRRTDILQQRAQLQQAVATSWQLLEQADEEAVEKQAIEHLRGALSKYFDFDLEQRELGLQAARQEIEKLDKKLQNRKSLTDSMVELQMKIELNQSNGLGFFSSPKG